MGQRWVKTPGRAARRCRRPFAEHPRPGYRRLVRSLRTTAIASALALALAGCSGGDTEPVPTASATSPDAPVLEPGTPGQPNSTLTGSDAIATPSVSHNDADVTFLTDMISHHAQAIVMSDIVKGRLTDSKVKGIASRIADEQKPEMEGMATTLRSWGEEVPPEAKNPKLVTQHGSHHSMPGMATQQQLTALENASGTELDRQYLDLMVAHHKGALTMCDTHGEKGMDERTGELADDINVTQTKQIEQMQQMRKRL